MLNFKSHLSLQPKALLAVLAAAALAACASAPVQNAMLDKARSDYAAASADPQVVRTAAADLRRAQEALVQAETAQRADKETATVNHYSYLASQRVASAQQAAQLAQAEQAVANSGTERNRILIDARTREAEAQRMQADAQQQAADAARRQAAMSATRANDLERQLAALNAKQTQRGLVLTLGDVLFDTGRATLNPGAGRTVDQLATFMKENPDRTVQIEGYTDSTGSSDLNQSLSEQRANSVKNALMDRGIGSERISARGYGPSNPVASNGTAAGRQQNRRIEIVVSNTTSG